MRDEDQIERIADHFRSLVRRSPSEELPDLWRELPDDAQFLWAEVYREARDTPDPALAAWDRVRELYTRIGEGAWAKKSNLTDYRESSDHMIRSWIDEDGEKQGVSLPFGSLDLPGNIPIPESEVDSLPEYVRRVYDRAFERALKSKIDFPHELACTNVRKEYRKGDNGEWTEKSEHEKRFSREHTREWIEMNREFFEALLDE